MSIKYAIVIPSYGELYALPAFLSELVELISSDTLVMVCDDSPVGIRHDVESLCNEVFAGKQLRLEFNFADSKTGRGAAVRRGMSQILDNYPSIEFILEADSDGSHRAIDVLKVLKFSESNDFVIGSRYLPSSEIVGWPLSRRVFSRILNGIIPKLFRINVGDVTNGLRRYSTHAVKVLLSEPIHNTGFIYLTEQALVLKSVGISPVEVETKFINRTLGKSTVTYREIYGSLVGIGRLIFSFRR